MSISKNDPHILHVSSATSWRGGGRQLAYLVEQLQEKKVKQAVFCVEGGSVSIWCKAHNIPFFSYRKQFSFNPWVAWRLKALCKRHSFNILHVHDSHSHTFAFLSSVLFQNKVPLIVHRRVDFPVGGSVFSRWKYNHPLVKRIICVSACIGQIVEKSLKDQSKVAVVYSGVQMEADMPAQRPDFLEGPDLPQFVIANIAAVAPHKDYYTFVRTAALLIREGVPARFYIIGGDGGEMKDIQRYVAELGLERQIVFTGFREDVPAILPFIDLLLFTSKTEGLGTTLLDAFVARVPVVATRAGGIPEIVEHGETGLLAPVGAERRLAENVQCVLKDERLRRRLVEHAFRKVKQFSRENMAAKIASIYREVISAIESH